MIVAVPEENLYEQGIWPSMFNPDHKATFRLDSSASWSPVSYDLRKLVADLPDAEVLEAEVQDAGYDRRLQRHGVGFVGRLAHFVDRVHKAIFRRTRVRLRALDALFDKAAWCFGKPIDQTLGEALAQIQVVVRKSAPCRQYGGFKVC